jgi:preprotein translocase subunit YajC
MDLLIALLLTFGLMWLLLIRPQQRRMRAHQQIVASLGPGDEVVTAGGIHGIVTSVDDEEVRVEIAPGVVIRVLRGAISQRTSPVLDEDDVTDDVMDDEDEDMEETTEVEPDGSRRTFDEDKP